MTRSMKLLILSMVLVSLDFRVSGFPDEGPVDTCFRPIPNVPYHEQSRPQNNNTNPYKLTASDAKYEPGAQITVKIQGSDFQGFFIQARDAGTNEWIGTWTNTPNTKVHGECSAVTHGDPREKQQANLVWTAPSNSRGNVYFTGTVLKKYDVYWTDVVSKVA